MLSDGVEASVRSLSSRDEATIRAMVGQIIQERLSDGQLDECDLTIRDLESIREAFVGQLLGMYHQRIAYPQSKVVELESRRESGHWVAREGPAMGRGTVDPRRPEQPIRDRCPTATDSDDEGASAADDRPSGGLRPQRKAPLPRSTFRRSGSTSPSGRTCLISPLATGWRRPSGQPCRPPALPARRR